MFEDGAAHCFNHFEWNTLSRIFLTLDTATMEWCDLLARMDAEMWRCKQNAHRERDNNHEMEDNNPLNRWLLKATQEADAQVADLDEALSSASLGDAPRAKPTVLSAQLASMKLGNCSWCGGPSAALKRCAACGKTRYVVWLFGICRCLTQACNRYCDSGCQKQHWKTHKTECRTAQSA